MGTLLLGCLKSSRMKICYPLIFLIILQRISPILGAACTTIAKKEPCVFPFIYKGVEYDQCTKVFSTKKVAWCATEVDRTGKIIDGRWGDCSESCPGARCVAETVEQCKATAAAQGLTQGSQKYSFEGNWDTKGCVAYKDGPYEGQAYWGTGNGDRTNKLTLPKYRLDCPEGYVVTSVLLNGEPKSEEGRFFILGGVTETEVKNDLGLTSDEDRWPWSSKYGRSFTVIQIRDGSRMWCGQVKMFGKKTFKSNGVYGKRLWSEEKPGQWAVGDLAKFVTDCNSK